MSKNVEGELKLVAKVDRAHLLMLVEQRIISPVPARALLRTIEELEARDFAPLQNRAAPRGLYLAYEGYLIERLGADVGGALHTARSRNDLNATTLKLRLRAPYLKLLGETLRLKATLIRRASRYARVTMPAYTHYQGA
ncbi:MAG: lyase family protein, partial [Blastocatellia bacterium]